VVLLLVVCFSWGPFVHGGLTPRRVELVPRCGMVF